jgi:hypothetical protein
LPDPKGNGGHVILASILFALDDRQRKLAGIEPGRP